MGHLGAMAIPQTRWTISTFEVSNDDPPDVDARIQVSDPNRVACCAREHILVRTLWHLQVAQGADDRGPMLPDQDDPSAAGDVLAQTFRGHRRMRLVRR